MDNVNDPSDNDEVRARRAALASWLTEQIDEQQIDRVALARAMGIAVTVLAGWEVGDGEVTLDQAVTLDRQLGLPVGSTGAAGGYFGFEADPASPEPGLMNREFDRVREAVAAVEAAIELGLGIRLRNQFVAVEEGPGWTQSDERWVLDLTEYPPLLGDPLV